MPLNCEHQVETPIVDTNPTPEKFQVTEVRDLEGNRMNVLKEFIKLKPPAFEGQSDPSAAERWLEEVKAMFNTMKVVDEYRVEFATYLFEGSAEEWWDLKGDDYDVDALKWDEFETLFRESYAPETLNQLARLSQRGMTVSEYHARFIELSSGDRVIEADPVSRCLRFRKGLKSDIKSKLEPFTYNELNDLVNAALSVESYLDQKRKDRNERLEQRKRQSLRDRVVRKTGVESSSWERKAPHGCSHCRQPGHIRRNCPLKQSSLKKPTQSKFSSGDVVMCYRCNQVGHIRRNCPQRKMAAQSAMLASVSVGARVLSTPILPPGYRPQYQRHDPLQQNHSAAPPSSNRFYPWM